MFLQDCCEAEFSAGSSLFLSDKNSGSAVIMEGMQKRHGQEGREEEKEKIENKT